MSRRVREAPAAPPPGPNDRPHGLCKHIDAETLPSGVAYCWARYIWVDPDAVDSHCRQVERADGGEPPGKLWFRGPRGERKASQ